MRYLTRFLAPLLALFLIAGCGSSDDNATDETTEATTTTAATATTTAAPTTTALEPDPGVDAELVPSFAAGVRDLWDRIVVPVGGTAPDLSDDEIAAIGTSVCTYLAAHPLPGHTKSTERERMEIYTDLAVIVTDALGMPYDPMLQDAGFESGVDARIVSAFKNAPGRAKNGGLCPAPTSGPGFMPCSLNYCSLFSSPWSLVASAQQN